MKSRTQHGIIAIAGVATAAAMITSIVSASDAPAPGTTGVNSLAMAQGIGDWTVDPVFTVGETLPRTPGADADYTPPGVLDGLGAYELDADTVRVFANHELGFNRGYAYDVSNGAGSTFPLTGARISYYDIDKSTRHVVAAGPAYDTIYDANGEIATDSSFLANDLPGFSRFCSGSLFEAAQFGGGRGLADRIYFAGEEDGGNFNPVGGAEWALDPETGDFWALPDLGRGAWENVTVLDTGDRNTVAILLADDSSPFDADGDGVAEAAPLYLYVGEKDPDGDFPAQNGLRGGTLYVFVADNGVTTPVDFNGGGTLKGSWVEIDNAPTTDDLLKSETGEFGFDEYGYPTQRTLWTRAEALGAFGFSRPEDVATNPNNGKEAVLASTGVDTYVGGVDTFGTLYTVKTNFNSLKADLEIIYDGDADPARTLRSPDNLDWADDGKIYVQEDKAEDVKGTEPLFGAGAANPNEAGIVQMNANGKNLERIANVDRGVVLDASLANPTLAFDGDYGDAGEWESSGILDVSELFGEKKGTLFLFDVQAHGIEDQDTVNATSRIKDSDLVEGGQLLFLERD
jgi:hypothetical protein